MKEFILNQPRESKDSVNQYSRIYHNMLSEIDNANCDICVKITKATRSLKQNAYLWGVCYPTIRRFMDDNHNKQYSDKAIHETCKDMFLPYNVEQLASREVKVYQTTTELNKKEFGDYLEHIFRWAGEFGCSIPAPDWNWKQEQKRAA